MLIVFLSIIEVDHIHSEWQEEDEKNSSWEEEIENVLISIIGNVLLSLSFVLNPHFDSFFLLAAYLTSSWSTLYSNFIFLCFERFWCGLM